MSHVQLGMVALSFKDTDAESGSLAIQYHTGVARPGAEVTEIRQLPDSPPTALLPRQCCQGEGREGFTSNPGPFTGSCLWSGLRASLGAGLRARGAGTGGTATAGPLQGALQDGLSSPEVRVAARTAEQWLYTLKNLTNGGHKHSPVPPPVKGIKRVLVWPWVIHLKRRPLQLKGSTETIVMPFSVKLLARYWIWTGRTLDPTCRSSHKRISSEMVTLQRRIL